MDPVYGVPAKIMSRVFLFLVLLGLLCSWIGFVWSHNPFTSKPETQQKAPEPLFKSRLFVKIILWQHQLKQKMSELIRMSQSEKRVKPLVVLMGLAFLYGVIHVAGPGHGKVVAMSYVLSHRATILGGMLFGLCFAFIQALSGAAEVVGLRYIIQRSVNETLTSVTTITQIVSFALITLLGLIILVKHGYAFVNPAASSKERGSGKASRKGVLAWAVTAGLVSCPAVVMVMLFCLSMDAIILGLLLVMCISIGMATTISFVVVTIVLGKTGVLSVVSKNYATRVEGTIGLLSGAAVSIFGTLFLLSTIILDAHSIMLLSYLQSVDESR
jgi:ABC-type nickel/cobalt efflux system permease component RcnA